MTQIMRSCAARRYEHPALAAATASKLAYHQAALMPIPFGRAYRQINIKLPADDIYRRQATSRRSVPDCADAGDERRAVL